MFFPYDDDDDDEAKGNHSIVPPLIDISLVCLEILQQLANQKMTTINLLAFMRTLPSPLNAQVLYICLSSCILHLSCLFGMSWRFVVSKKPCRSLILSFCVFDSVHFEMDAEHATNFALISNYLQLLTIQPTNKFSTQTLTQFRAKLKCLPKKPNISHPHSFQTNCFYHMNGCAHIPLFIYFELPLTRVGIGLGIRTGWLYRLVD